MDVSEALPRKGSRCSWRGVACSTATIILFNLAFYLLSSRLAARAPAPAQQTQALVETSTAAEKADVIDEMLDAAVGTWNALAPPPPPPALLGLGMQNKPVAKRPHCFCPPPQQCFCKHAGAKAHHVLFPKMPGVPKQGLKMQRQSLKKASVAKAAKKKAAKKKAAIKKALHVEEVNYRMKHALATARQNLLDKEMEMQKEKFQLDKAVAEGRDQEHHAEEKALQGALDRQIREEADDLEQAPKLAAAALQGQEELRVEQAALVSDADLDGLDRPPSPQVERLREADKADAGTEETHSMPPIPAKASVNVVKPTAVAAGAPPAVTYAADTADDDSLNTKATWAPIRG